MSCCCCCLWLRVETQKMAVSVSVSVSEVVGDWRFLCQSGIYQYQRKFNIPNTPLFLRIRNPMPIRFTRSERFSSCVVPRSLDPQTKNQNSDTSSQEADLWYVGKLLVGSFAGGAVIKYGSALFPEITTPNIVLALVIITTPVLVSVFLLIKESLPKP